MERTEFTLEAVAPFRLDYTVWALRRRPHNIVDRWDGHLYQRTLVVEGVPVEVAVQSDGEAGSTTLRVAVDGPRPVPGVRQAVGGCLERMLGLKQDLRGFYRLAAKDRRLHALSLRFRGLKPPRFPTIFEAVVNGIACQQITLTAGLVLLNRLAQCYGRSPGQQVASAPAFPEPAHLADHGPASLRALGFSRQKSRSILDLAAPLARGDLNLEALSTLNDAALRERLRALHGIGPWTADYVLLRGYGRIDVFPVDDVGARNNLRRWRGLPGPLDPERARRLLARWRPRGLIYFHLLLEGLARSGVLTPDDHARALARAPGRASP